MSGACAAAEMSSSTASAAAGNDKGADDDAAAMSRPKSAAASNGVGWAGTTVVAAVAGAGPGAGATAEPNKSDVSNPFMWSLCVAADKAGAPPNRSSSRADSAGGACAELGGLLTGAAKKPELKPPSSKVGAVECKVASSTAAGATMEA
jgi:hypothetical protein